MTGPYTPNPTDPTRPLNDDEVQYGAEELRKLKLRFSTAFSNRILTGLTYTLVTDDIGNMIEMSNGGTITIPSGLGAGLIGITGKVTLTQVCNIVAGVGVTLVVAPSLQAKLFESNAFAVLMRLAANRWLLSGNLAFTVLP